VWLYKSPKVINPYIPVKLQLYDGVQGVRNVVLFITDVNSKKNYKDIFPKIGPV